MKPYSAGDVAARLGRDAEWFHRNYARLVRDDGMPEALTSFGRKRFDRASIDAWLGRHHPAAPKRPANDTAPPLAPDNHGAWRAALLQHGSLQ